MIIEDIIPEQNHSINHS